ncbi:MAG TPA: DNA polymerase III subunit alpha [Patescibacteria group bacterium]|nr:DNA polymerase III subunit alpha [Patescibacteria group bacterium]
MTKEKVSTRAGRPVNVADFVHLHNHTQYSLLDGLTKIPALIEETKRLGMESIAITDHGTLSGVVEFYKESNALDVKPIFGIEAYVAPRKLSDKDPAKDKNYYHLILIATSNVGYENLMRLSTIANLEGYYYKPRIDHRTLEKYQEGLIVLSGCIGGEIGDALRQGQYEQAKKTAEWYKSVFGDRYFLEVQDHGHPKHPSHWPEQLTVNEQVIKLGKELDIECVITCDAHYLKHEDQEAHEILLCVQTGSFLSDEKRMTLKNFELHVTDPKEIISRWGKDYPQFIKNTAKIAKRCAVKLDLGKILIPKFPTPKNETEKSYLDKLTYAGLVRRYVQNRSTDGTVAQIKKILPKEIVERADYELGVIDRMGFNGYFLIVQDFINWGKDRGIIFGPGRGSAAGSIVSYALKITELDPLTYDLLFERMLNPERISMPDIDIDIQDNRRDEVIKYCVDKYGSDRVANIVTFGRMAARNAVRDVARVLQVPYVEADRLAKMIPPPIQGRHIPLSKSIQENSDLSGEYKTNETAKKVFDLAMQLEGTIRSHGVHAAGVVIAPENIVKYAPLEMAQKGVITTQYSMGPIEDLGLLKIDFLGLSNLTIIKNAMRIVKKVYKESVDLENLPLDDVKTYELLQNGHTTGVFQFESSGMKRYLKDLRPTVFDDIIAMGALYRPGPLTAGLTQKFINRKNGIEPITYEHPSMKSALETTYGVLVYQEQVMRIAQDMCGFSGGEADTLRKAIGKKKRDVMAKMKKQFIDGAVKTSNVTREFGEKFWKDLEGFADYAFNKSHSACYGLISYQTAYLKAHFPSAFMAALMTSDYDDTDRLAIEINECKKMSIEVLPPDVNESFVEFAIVPKTKQIRFGMAAVKNVGTAAVEEILRARQEGAFNSLEDFFSRVSTRIVNRKALESLIKAGALDRFAERSILLHNLDMLLAYANRSQKQAASGQTDLFGNQTDENESKPKLALDASAIIYSTHDQLTWERELLGLYLSQHPLKAFEGFLAEHTIPVNNLKPEHDNRSVSVGGAIQDVREITTKSGQHMAFVKIGDQFGEIELVLFPSVYQKTTGIWSRDKVVFIKGKVTTRDKTGSSTNEVKILVEDAREVTHEQASAYKPTGKKPKLPKAKAVAPSSSILEFTAPAQKVYIRMINSDQPETLLSLKTAIDENKGETEVVLVLGPADQKQAIKLPMRISHTEQVLKSLKELVGSDNVKVQ